MVTSYTTVNPFQIRNPDCRPSPDASKRGVLSGSTLFTCRDFYAKYNKKSAESGVAPAGIKSHKFLFVLKKNLFCSIQEIGGLVCKKMDKVENLECLYQGYGDMVQLFDLFRRTHLF